MPIEKEPHQAVSRTTVMTAQLNPPMVSDHVEVRRITIQPNTVAGAHVHNGPVVGNIVDGSVIILEPGEHPELAFPDATDA